MPIEIREDLMVEMKPIKILDQSFKELRNKIFVRKGECKPWVIYGNKIYCLQNKK